MKNKCNSKNPLLRDGTSQQQRLLNALLPSYVSVDERSMNDLIKFASDFSKEIKYYGPNNQPNGNWEAFFSAQNIDRTNQRTQPHYALFIAFLEMFKILQNDLNTITQRHLEYYYKEVLRIKEREAIPDQVFIIFGLAKGAASTLVPSGSSLDGGEDNSGVKRVYATSKNLVVNNAQVKELKAVFYNKTNDHRIYASPVANSADGKGAEIEGEEKKWKTFGAISRPGDTYSTSLVDREGARTGFAISSPILLMFEGTRDVTISLKLNSAVDLSNNDLQQAFITEFSGDEEWIRPAGGGDSGYLDGNSINIYCSLQNMQPGVVPFNRQKLGHLPETPYPVVKVMLNPNAPKFIYSKLKNLNIRKAEIKIVVYGIRNLVLQNDFSALDPARSILPFGSNPVLGSNFYVGSNEVFSKRLSSVSLNINWKGLPKDTGGFKNYYHHYLPVIDRTTDNFRVNISMLDGQTWKPLLNEANDSARLFNRSSSADTFKGTSDSPGGGGGGGATVSDPDNYTIAPNRIIGISGGALSGINWDYASAIRPTDEYTVKTRRGFMRLQLAGVDFGHSNFQFSFASQALKAAAARINNINQSETTVTNQDGTTTTSVTGTNTETSSAEELKHLPNQPYTPEIAELSLDYSASSTVNFEDVAAKSESTFNSRLDRFFHVEAFGAAERHPFLQIKSSEISLLPMYQDEGSLMIGLIDTEPGQVVSLLFKSAEGTSNPDLLKQKLNWTYLSGNHWVPFEASAILSDTTNGFLSSGIVEFEVPISSKVQNSLLSPNLFWLKVAITDHSFSACQMIEVQTQAVTAAFVDNENDPDHLLESLSSDNITGLINSLAGIKEVMQPYASFGGKIKEKELQFYTRVSEQLRHKNRAVTIWDYERLVLEKFPSIYKVKCVNHARITSPQSYNLVAPGNISMLVISNVRNKNAINPLKPTTSLLVLDEVKEYLIKQASPAVKVHVCNPIYEEVRVSFNVKFTAGYDAGFYSKKLNEDIRAFLAPWAFNTADITFGGIIHRSVILNFVEERDYVDYVTVFKMDHLIGDEIISDITEINASSPASVLTSANSHNITVLIGNEKINDSVNLVNKAFAPIDDNCDCFNEPSTYGINYNSVGVNFVVGGVIPIGNEGLGLMAIDENFSID